MRIDIASFELLDPPPRDHVIQALYQLWVLGAVDQQLHLTRVGSLMVR